MPVGRASALFRLVADRTLRPISEVAGLGHTTVDVVFHSPVTIAGYESRSACRPLSGGDFQRRPLRMRPTDALPRYRLLDTPECSDRLRKLTNSIGLREPAQATKYDCVPDIDPESILGKSFILRITAVR